MGIYFQAIGQRNLKCIDFQPGILHTVMSLLQLKTHTMEDSNKYCGIVMDEMSIKATLEYDVGDQLVRGYNTLKPSSDGLATHALIFALVGVKTRWKQVVAYHFTGSTDIVSTYRLPSSTISLQPFQDLILLQRDRELKLQARLPPKSINLGNFGKMKVLFASDLLSHATGSVINFLVDKSDYPESYLTATWFCEQVGH
ncbi:unnamed protein product [Lepeophtheirus salmonis]|uniref:(salmon louse) hypothetical protein n=1 Tax=Lepeophtheirus salmonis TaxID=72036 RepID=A0A7R8D5E8_LEPSM|nr:unnamed protein product [Lepeophtheirus salmonis]CAF3004297.1 unnamed protein product [Lepeophtheirus salmonis]